MLIIDLVGLGEEATQLRRQSVASRGHMASVEPETPKAPRIEALRGEAVSPPKPIRGSGERRKLPQRDPKQSQLTWAVSPPKIGCYRPHPPRRPICSQLGPLRQPGITSTNGTSPQMSGCRPKESVVRANQSCLLGDPEDVSDYRPNLEATQDVTLYGSASLL